MMSRRIGKFNLSIDSIENKELAVGVFRHLDFIPLRVECLMYINQYEFIGISDSFDDVPLGCVTPEYQIDARFNVDNDCFDFIVTRIYP